MFQGAQHYRDRSAPVPELHGRSRSRTPLFSGQRSNVFCRIRCLHWWRAFSGVRTFLLTFQISTLQYSFQNSTIGTNVLVPELHYTGLGLELHSLRQRSRSRTLQTCPCIGRSLFCFLFTAACSYVWKAIVLFINNIDGVPRGTLSLSFTTLISNH